MFGERKLSQYKETKVPAPEPSYIHKTFTPKEETKDNVRFDIRSVGKVAHMSSTIFLERKIQGKIVMPSRVPERFTMKDAYGPRKQHGIASHAEVQFLRKPGFVLQENMKRLNFSFNAGDVHSETEWLAPYCKLYPQSLKPFVRNSGKSFSNQNDQIHRGGQYMTHHYDVVLAQTGAVEADYGVRGHYIYVNPERNDRREMDVVAKPNMDNYIGEVLDSPMVAWYGQPSDITDLQMEHPNDLTTPIANMSLFRPARANLQTAGPAFDYIIPVAGQGNPDLVLDSTESLISDHFQNFYKANYKAEDDAKYQAFDTARKALYVNGVLLDGTWYNAGLWGNMKNLFQEIFQTEAHADDVGDAGENGSWEDTLRAGWGVDLRRPFYDYVRNPAVSSPRKFYIRTAAAMLQFADEIQRWRIIGLRDHALVVDLREKAARIAQMTAAIVDPTGMAFIGDDLIARIAIMNGNDADAQAAEALTLAELESELNQIQYLLTAYNMPTVHANGQTLVQQVTTLIATDEAALAQAETAFRTAHQAFHEWDHTQENRDWLFSLQIMSRILSWMDNDHNKEAESLLLIGQNRCIDTTFIEPLMVGPCKPSEYSNIGCYGGNSNLIPYVDRFRMDLQFKKDSQYFEVDSYTFVGSEIDPWTGEVFIPTIEIEKTETKLHCLFVEQPVPLPVSVPYVDVKTIRLGDTQSLSKGIPATVNFQDIDIRRTWKYMMIYTKLREPREYTANDPRNLYPESDKSAAITAVKISTDLQANCINADSHYQVNAMTVRNFNEYVAPVGKTGGVLGLVFNELPQRKTVSGGFNHINGSVSIEQDWSDGPVEIDVYMSILRTDVMLEIDENFAKSNIHLSDLP